jgi:hypothetical protein
MGGFVKDRSTMTRVGLDLSQLSLRNSVAGFAVVAATGALLAGCSAGSTASLQQPSLQQPGAGASPGSSDSRSASEIEKIDAAALKASRLAVFATATPPKGAAVYTHVWAPILRIELLDEKASAQTIWDGGPEGMLVDLSTLAGNGSGGSSRFLGIVGAPVNGGKAIERVRITFGKAFELYTAGTSVAKTTLIADAVTRDSEGHPTVSFPLTKPRDLSTGKENLIIDFDLGALTVKDDKLTPALREGDGTDLADLTRQVETTFVGTVSGIGGTPPSARFVLTPEVTSSPAMLVQTSPSTSLFNDDPNPNPALAEKQRVRVRGVLSPETKRIVATEIAMFAPTKSGSPAASAAGAASALTGTISHVNADDRTFAMEAAQVEGLTPTQTVVTVTVSADAVLRSRGGLPLKGDDFWATIKAKGAAPLLRVDGVYDPVRSTLDATRVKIESPTLETTHEANAEGTAKFVDIGAKSFTLATPLVKWDGMEAPDEKGKGIPVSITAATEFRDDTGQFLAPAHFFETATKEKDKTVVRVVGLYNSKGAFTATRVELSPKPAPIAAASPSPAAGATPTPAGSAATPTPAAASAPTPAAGGTGITTTGGK